MKTYIEVPKQYVAKELNKVTCDICREEIKDTKVYDVSETEISHKNGWSSPDGGSGTLTEIDLCPKCFKEKLVPWVESFGTKIEVKEWGF